MHKLEELAAKVEQLAGPSIMVDRDIALAIYPGAMSVHGNDARISVWDGNGRTQLTVKPYTALLDAAMTLVPQGWRKSLCDDPDDTGGVIAELWTRSGHAYADAATAALALCAAALKARAIAHHGEEGHG